jgi:hypothetical protein
MARKPAAALLLIIGIGLFALEFAYDFSFAAGSRVDKSFNDALLGFALAVEPSGDVDELPTSPTAAVLDVFPSSVDGNLQLRSAEKVRLSRKGPGIYKLQHTFLL